MKCEEFELHLFIKCFITITINIIIFFYSLYKKVYENIALCMEIESYL